MHTDEKRNVISLIGKDAISALSQTFTTVSVIQAFLISLGVAEFQLGVLNTFTNAAIMLGMIAFMGRIDTIGPDKIISTNSRLYITACILPAALLTVSILETSTGTGSMGAFIIVAAAWSAQNFINGIRGMTDTRVMQNIIRPERYGFVYGMDGIVLCIMGVMGGLVIKPLIEQLEETRGFEIIFLTALLLVPGPVIFSKRFKLLGEHIVNKTYIKNPFSYFSYTFKSKTLRNISFLHLCRGAVSGLLFFILPMGIRHFNTPLSYAAYIVIVNAAAGIIGYFFINMFYDRAGTVNSMVISTVMCLMGLAGFIAVRTPVFFLVSLTLFMTGQTITQQCVPLGVFKVTPPNFTGTFTGVRLFIMQSAEAVFAFFMGLLITGMPVFLYFLFIALFIIVQMWLAKYSFMQENTGCTSFMQENTGNTSFIQENTSGIHKADDTLQ